MYGGGFGRGRGYPVCFVDVAVAIAIGDVVTISGLVMQGDGSAGGWGHWFANQFEMMEALSGVPRLDEAVAGTVILLVPFP